MGGDKVLDEYYQRQDVLDFIKELKTNPKYRKMIVPEQSQYGKHIGDELALYLFYDIVLKYKIIIDDPFLFVDFLSQIEKLFRKIDDYDDLVRGVQKVLIRLVETILDIQDHSYMDIRREVATYIYDKYIMNGYFVHGFSSVYEEFIQKYSFVPERYPNRYTKMLVVQEIFSKYKVNLLNKDFYASSVSFTDDFIMGCYYSISSPGFYYELLCNESFFGKKPRQNFLKMDYYATVNSLRKYMINHSFSDFDRKRVLEILQEEWELLHRVPRKVSLLFVKRSKLMDVSHDKLEDYLESDKNLQEIVDCIFSSKYPNVTCEKSLKISDFQMVSLDDFYRVEQKEKVQIESGSTDLAVDQSSFKLLNSYGTVSILLLLGSLLITLGVIVSIIMVLRGM